MPQLYSHLTTLSEGKTSRINPLHPTYTTWPALRTVLTHSLSTRGALNWTLYLPPPVRIIPPTQDEKTAQHLSAMLTGSTTQEWKLLPVPLSNVTSVRLNPYIIEQADCTFGCLGHLCDAPDGCAPDLLCKNSVCQMYPDGQPGGVGQRCNSKAICQPHFQCVKGVCEACSARKTIQPKEQERKRTIEGDDTVLPVSQQARVRENDVQGSCYTDSLPHIFQINKLAADNHDQHPLRGAALPICQHPSSSSSHPPPCHNPTHCSASEYCSWGSCLPCSPTTEDMCLGSLCRSNAACKTGYCNDYGRCDYVRKKKVSGPGGARGKRNGRIPGVPKGHERGPARVRSEALRVNIPGEKVLETGGPVVMATA
jgi:hypothetical protein